MLPALLHPYWLRNPAGRLDQSESSSLRQCTSTFFCVNTKTKIVFMHSEVGTWPPLSLALGIVLCKDAVEWQMLITREFLLLTLRLSCSTFGLFWLSRMIEYTVTLLGGVVQPISEQEKLPSQQRQSPHFFMRITSQFF